MAAITRKAISTGAVGLAALALSGGFLMTRTDAASLPGQAIDAAARPLFETCVATRNPSSDGFGQGKANRAGCACVANHLKASIDNSDAAAALLELSILSQSAARPTGWLEGRVAYVQSTYSVPAIDVIRFLGDARIAQGTCDARAAA